MPTGLNSQDEKDWQSHDQYQHVSVRPQSLPPRRATRIDTRICIKSGESATLWLVARPGGFE